MSWAAGIRITATCILGVLALNSYGQNLVDLTLEELMDLEVTTASKRLQPVRDVPAPITVITAEDIRRSQAQSLPELLQRVPGFFVGRLHGGAKAISARTAAERFSNKLLVMIDGRSVYSPAFSGVLWEQQHVMLENVERIEVIRGPGGALWGANAVNGIVNVITKDAAQTQGGLVSTTAGTNLRRAALRYGFSPAKNLNVRLYANGLEEDAGYADGGTNDDWRQGRIGMRADGATNDDKWSLQAEVNKTNQGTTVTIPDAGANFPNLVLATDDRYVGAHVLGKWDHECANGDELSLQAYWDTAELDSAAASYRHHTFDLDVQRHMQLTDRQELVLGIGYRGIDDDFDEGKVVIADPDERYTNLYSAFIQHELELIEEKLKLTSGLKAEYNDYTHDEWQPSLRLSYTPKDDMMLWLGWSRAARTPSRVGNDMIFNQAALNNTGDYVQLFGSEQLESEYVQAWEAGLRVLANEKLSIDVAVYYHDYDNMRTFERQGNTPPGAYQLIAENNLYGEAYGVETTLTWRPTPRQSYYLAYTYADAQFHLKSGSQGTESSENEFPHHQAFLAADWEIRQNVNFGINLRYVDNAVSEGLSSRTHLDARISWRPTENCELSIVGQSLLDPSHAEFGTQPTISNQTTQERRSIVATLRWNF